MDIYLIDGTYELFRHFFAVPKSRDAGGQEIGAVRGVVTSILSMLEKGTTYLGVATDHVIESFRNELYSAYKTGEGLEEELVSQFVILEDALTSMGVLVWPMIEFEADDALAAAAHKADAHNRVSKVTICTPDKDLSQCVVGQRVVQLDRMRNTTRDEAGVVEKFGVTPASIPDYLALVGDTADGYPGLPGWGAKAAASVLSRYVHLEGIPKESQQWDPSIRNSRKLATTLFEAWEEALLFRTLATLRTDVPVFDDIDQLKWRGPHAEFEKVANRLKAPDLFRRANAAANR
ncbi:MAG TPA: 5'-3' exonuclease H3TH domain-containing protein [Candidatus Obscuribacterales bacterium]